MNIDSKVFWTLLDQSHLPIGAGIDSLQSQVNAELKTDKGQEPNAESIAKLLVQSKVITKYQAQILLAGRSGPFRFGSYLVVDRLQDGPHQGLFAANHVPSGHPVLIHFCPGEDEQAVSRWRTMKRQAESWKSIRSRNLIQLYETLTLPDYRACVLQSSGGHPLATKLPRKGRLPWKDACAIAAQIAAGLMKVHQTDCAHGSITPKSIWLPAKGPAKIYPPLELGVMGEQHPGGKSDAKPDPKAESPLDYLAPELRPDSRPDSEPTKPADIYALGCILHRMIRGLPPFYEAKGSAKQKAHQNDQPASLAKYELPQSLEDLLSQMLAKDPQSRPDAKDAAMQLAKHTHKPEQVLKLASPVISTEAAYQKSVESSVPIMGMGESPQLETETPNIVLPDAPAPRPAMDTSISEARLSDPRPKRKKRNSLTLVVMAASLATFAAVIGLGIWIAMTTEFQSPKVVINDEQPDEDPDANSVDDDQIDSAPTGRLVQVLFDDDGKRLWEAPTAGQPVDFGYLPTGAQIVVNMRPKSLLSNPEGNRMIQGLGPDFESHLEWLSQSSGFPLEEIDRLLIAFCSTNQIEFTPCYVVHLSEPIERDKLVALWRPQVTGKDDESGVYRNDAGFGYFVIADPDNPELASGFSMGPVEQINEVSELAGANPLSSILKDIAIRSDDQRHFSCMFVPNSLFNDEGQALLSGKLASARGYLRDHLPADLRCGMFSFHLDQGLYLEMYASHLPKIKPRAMSEQLDRLIQQVRDDVAATLVNYPANPHWDQLRSRFGIMVNEIYRNTRVGVEGPDVLANCWLPEIAAHNLVTGTELALTFSAGASTPAVVKPKIPATLQELLQTPRDLSVTTNPDLGLLLAGIKSAIQDDYGSLPFEFDIRLMGNDLLKDGITQNQRPGDFELKQKTLAEILTEIMFRANPDKGATGPNDLACKLIWVVAEEPAGSGQPTILITTRDAAADKGYELPDAFVPEQ